jgi:integrase
MAAKTHGQVLNELELGKFVRISKVIPCGSLEARKLSSGAVTFYWRGALAGKTLREVIGIYDPVAPPKSLTPTPKGFSIVAAGRAAESLATIHEANLANGGYPSVKAAEVAAKELAESEKVSAAKYTLRSLLTSYADHLEKLGRSSHSDVRSIFKLHVFERWPNLADRPASQLTSEEVADMMRKVVELGKGRTANKLRSYVRAAYQTAKASRTKASIPVSFKGFGITSNPAADTEPDESANRSDKHPLSLKEMRAYWSSIKQAPGFKAAVLRLHLLTGGQRIKQLVCLMNENVKDDQILLFDGKGRPGQAARRHTVPLIASAKIALDQIRSSKNYALSTDDGETHLAATTLSAWAVEAASDIPGFKAKRIRSGVETVLASCRVEEKLRGRLQSHGVSGVQARHYDAHDYLDEKCHALEVLFQILEGADPKQFRINSMVQLAVD